MRALTLWLFLASMWLVPLLFDSVAQGNERSVRRARPFEGGFMVLPLVNRHMRPESLAHALAQRRSVRAGRSTRLPVHV